MNVRRIVSYLCHGGKALVPALDHTALTCNITRQELRIVRYYR